VKAKVDFVKTRLVVDTPGVLSPDDSVSDGRPYPQAAHARQAWCRGRPIAGHRGNCVGSTGYPVRDIAVSIVVTAPRAPTRHRCDQLEHAPGSSRRLTSEVRTMKTSLYVRS